MLTFGTSDFFFHIPRCGGNYTIRAVKGLRKNGKKIKMSHFGRAHGCPLEAKRPVGRSFVILRDPLSWYRSFYRFRIYKHYGIQKRDPGHALDFFIWEKAGGPIFDFDYFLKKVVERFPLGYLTGIYTRFFPFVNRVLWLPNLTESLPALFKNWGYDTPVTLPPKPKNESPKDIPAECSKEAMEGIRSSERAIIHYLKGRSYF